MTFFVSWVAMDQAAALYILTGADDAAIILDDTLTKAPDLSSQLVYVSTAARATTVTLSAGRPSRCTTAALFSPSSPGRRPFPLFWAGCISSPAPWIWWLWI